MSGKQRFPDDLQGLAFGRLTPVEITGRDKSGQRWLCKCECGVEKVIQRCALVSGAAKSCGCYNLEKTAERGRANRKHGAVGTSTYKIWAGMHKRCNDLKDSRYGGRGIKVCERWSEFENFLADMGKRPEGMSIERDKVDGNYEPGNCRWATDVEQANNRRSTRYIEFNGKRQSMTMWAREIGINPLTLRARLEMGWTAERALTFKGKS